MTMSTSGGSTSTWFSILAWLFSCLSWTLSGPFICSTSRWESAEIYTKRCLRALSKLQSNSLMIIHQVNKAKFGEWWRIANHNWLIMYWWFYVWTIFYSLTSSSCKGRIMNRFTKDIGNLDEYLPLTMFDTLDIGLRIIGTIIIVLVSNYYFLPPALVLLWAYWYIRSFFLTCSRGIKRVETVSKCHSHK